MFKCPYCQIPHQLKGKIPFNSWVAVQHHMNKCKKNTGTYVICSYYGPINLLELNKLNSIENIKFHYPNITFNESHWYRFRKSGIFTVKQKVWNREEVINALQECYSRTNKSPLQKDFNNTQGKYPSFTTVQKLFGSWNNGLLAANLPLNYSAGFGEESVGKDGVTYRSKFECYFVDNYLYHKHKYIYEPPYGNGWVYDFYLPEYKVYIELAGGLRKSRIEEKVQYHIENNIKCLILEYTKVYSKSFSLENELKLVINR